MIPTGPLSDHEIRLAKCLGSCTFLPGSWEKKFVQNINIEGLHLTARQRWFLYFLVHRYRRQTGKKAGECGETFLKRFQHCPEKEKPKKKKPDPEPVKIEVKENNSDNQLKLFSI